jgi:hopanoid biosynthesis associated RND transporter like protein HpnN
MAEFIVRLVEASRRHAWLVAGLMLLLAIAGAVYTAGHIAIDSDIDKLIATDLPWRQREAAMDHAFPQNTDLLVIVIDGETPEQADDAAMELRDRLAAMPNLFKSVRIPEGGPFFRKEGLLFPPTEDLQRFADQLIAAQPLIGTLAADPSLRGIFGTLDLLAQGARRGDVAASAIDPVVTAVADATDAALGGRYAPLSWQALLSGSASDQRGLRRFVLTQPVLDYSSVMPGESATAAVRAAAAAAGLTPDRGVRVRLTGPVALNDDQFSALKAGAGFSTALSVGLLCLWLLLALRSLRLVTAILVTLVVGLVLCASFGTLAVGAFNPISAAFAVLFVGIAVDFGIQFAVRYRAERFERRELADALRQTARGIGGPIVVAAAATAVGFFSFVPTDYTGVSDLGIVAGFGMLIALALNLTLLPALLTLLRPRGEPRPVGFARLAPLDRLLLRRRRPIIVVAAIVALLCLALLPALKFDFNPLHLQSPKAESVATLDDLSADPINTPHTIEILAPSLGTAEALSKRLDGLPEVAQTVTAASFVPEDQQAKLAILADAATLLGPTLSPPATKPAPSREETLEAMARLAEDLRQLGAKGDAAAERLAAALDSVALGGGAKLAALDANVASGAKRRLADLRVALAAEPVTLATLPPDIKSDWMASDGRARIEVFPKGDARDNAVLRRFVAAVRSVAPEATGEPVTIQESAATVIGAFITAGWTAIVAIALLLLAVLRRIFDVVLVLAPLALAGLLTLATSVLLGLSLNFANIIALPLLLGIGVAFDIYFVMRWRAGMGELLQSSTARAILFSALTTGTAFGSLALSTYPGTSEMGKLLTLALAYTLLCTFIVLPALLGPVRNADGPRPP